MPNLTVTEKYAQPEVVGFWKQLSETGLQQCEQMMIERYFPARGRLLDVGCGAGRAMLALERAGYTVTGVDLSLTMLAAGRSLSATAPLGGATLLALPFADASFDGVFMFFGALQHLPGQINRRRALAEMGRVTRPGGRLILGLDNIAPALLCYGYWLAQKIWPLQFSSKSGPVSKTGPLWSTSQTIGKNGADSTLWSRETRQIHPFIWHARGLARTLRWRTWPALVDVGRWLNPLNRTEVGDTRVAQFAVPVTPGRIYYHLYRAPALIEEATQAGWRLLGEHSGSALNEGRTYPAVIRRRDKQVLFAFERGGI